MIRKAYQLIKISIAERRGACQEEKGKTYPPQNNKSTELRLIEIFKQNGIIGWQKNYPVKGYPDFVFPKKKIAVFVDGGFWHGHDCRNIRPADHQEYWQEKREWNMKHDKEVTAMFEERGWTVLRIW